MSDPIGRPVTTVVLDSTSLVSDLLLRSAPLVSLTERCRSGALTLVVPEVVVRETVARFGRFCEEVAGLERRSAALRSRLGLEGLTVKVDIESELSDYDRRLRDLLKSKGALIAPIPAVAHEELVDRAVMRRKPFAESGTGYRDALIWSTVLRHVGDGPAVLVTNNHRDFAESDDRISLVCSDLARDLVDTGIRHDAVLIASDVSAAIEHVFLRHERLLDQSAADVVRTTARCPWRKPVHDDAQPNWSRSPARRKPPIPRRPRAHGPSGVSGDFRWGRGGG